MHSCEREKWIGNRNANLVFSEKLCCLAPEFKTWPFNPETLSMGRPLSSTLRLLQDRHAYPVTVPLFKEKNKNQLPLSTVQQEMLQSDAQWTTVTFMGQDAHSNASWFSQSGTWDTMTPPCKTPRADRIRAEKTFQQQTLGHELVSIWRET